MARWRVVRGSRRFSAERSECKKIAGYRGLLAIGPFGPSMARSVRNQPGFRYREFKYSEEDCCWIDEIFWDSLEEAKAAAENFPNAPECKSFMRNINTVISLSHIDGADTTLTLENA